MTVEGVHANVQRGGGFLPLEGEPGGNEGVRLGGRGEHRLSHGSQARRRPDNFSARLAWLAQVRVVRCSRFPERNYRGDVSPRTRSDLFSPQLLEGELR